MQSQHATGVILVVEDEILVRDLAVELLADLGLTIVEAGTAQEAIDALGNIENLAGVVTDVSMPGSLDGVDVARFVRANFPQAGIVISSGRQVSADRDVPKGSLFLAKPWTMDGLLSTVERAIAAS